MLALGFRNYNKRTSILVTSRIILDRPKSVLHISGSSVRRFFNKHSFSRLNPITLTTIPSIHILRMRPRRSKAWLHQNVVVRIPKQARHMLHLEPHTNFVELICCETQKSNNLCIELAVRVYLDSSSQFLSVRGFHVHVPFTSPSFLWKRLAKASNSPWNQITE